MSFRWRNFSAKIRRRESPFYDALYSIAKKIYGVSFPVHKSVHGFLYDEWALRTGLWHEFWRVIYYEPIFKSQCQEVGPGFRMEYAGNGTTRIHGNLKIYLGSNVTIFDNISFVGLKVFDNPEIFIGDNCYISPNVHFFVGRQVTIGNFSIIGSRLIADNQGHPFDDVIARMQSGCGSPRPETFRPIKIGDFCFLTMETVVYPGTTIGDGVVATYGTHLCKFVPPFCLVGGNPWKIIRKLPIPDELRDIVGDERYRGWKEQQDSVIID